MGGLLADIHALAIPSLVNVYFAAAAIPLGFVFAIAVALARASGGRWTKRVAAGFTYALRGSPLFIQLFMVYSLMLSLNLSVWRPLGVDWFVLHPLFLGPLVLTLNTTAYTAEIFYGAMRAVPKGEIDAAKAYGMSAGQRLRSVIWPNMIRTAWPAYTNEVVFLFQATALIYFTLPVVESQRDLMSKAGDLFQRDFNAALHYSVAALYFVAISLVVFWLMGLVYRRLMRHTLPPETLRFRLQLWR